MNVGLMVNGWEIDRWEANALEHLLNHSESEVSVVIENMESHGLDFYIRQMRNDGIWAINGGMRLLKRKLNRSPSYRKPVSLQKLLGEDSKHLQCKPVPRDGMGLELPDKTINTVSDEVDVLIRFGFGIIVGDILTAPTHGVLSYHHGNIREYRGRPPGFWEFMHNKKTAGITVQKLTETLDGGQIAAEKEIDISDCETWQEVKYTMYTESNDLLSEAVKNLKAGTVNEIESLGNLYTSPDSKQYMKYLWKNWLR